jgi:hypothetical protein
VKDTEWPAAAGGILYTPIANRTGSRHVRFALHNG